MKFLAVLAVIALASAASLSTDNTVAEWEAWKSAHNKIYASEDEEAIRFQNYLNNIEYFAKMNELEDGAEFGVGGPFSVCQSNQTLLLSPQSHNQNLVK